MRKFTSLLLLGFALGSFAQTPGGVSGSELWFKTAPLNSDLQGYYRWQDFSGDSIRLMLLDSRGVKSELTLPNSSVHYFNFNPSLWLADGFRSLSANLKHGDLSQATVIGVFSPVSGQMPFSPTSSYEDIPYLYGLNAHKTISSHGHHTVSDMLPLFLLLPLCT